MAAFVFSCLLLMLIEVHRRELANRQKSMSAARCRPQQECGRRRWHIHYRKCCFYDPLFQLSSPNFVEIGEEGRTIHSPLSPNTASLAFLILKLFDSGGQVWL